MRYFCTSPCHAYHAVSILLFLCNIVMEIIFVFWQRKLRFGQWHCVQSFCADIHGLKSNFSIEKGRKDIDEWNMSENWEKESEKQR